MLKTFITWLLKNLLILIFRLIRWVCDEAIDALQASMKRPQVILPKKDQIELKPKTGPAKSYEPILVDEKTNTWEQASGKTKLTTIKWLIRSRPEALAKALAEGKGYRSVI